MTAPALAWEQTGTVPQRTTRMATGGALGRPTAVFAGGVLPTTQGGSHGVVASGDLTPSGTTLTIAFTVGGCFINGTSSIAQGTYYWYNDVAGATTTLAAYNSQPRIDLVGVRVNDNAEDASGSTGAAFASVTGTPAASPVVPTVPAGFLVVGQVAVPATSGATMVTPKKTYAAGLGGLIRCTSATRPTGVALWQGQTIYEMDTDREWRANASGVWVPRTGRYGIQATGGGSLAGGGGGGSLTWTTEVSDTDGFGAGSTTITIPAGLGGVYAITAVATSGTASTASYVIAIIVGASTGIAWGYAGVGNANMTASIVKPLPAGTTFHVDIANYNAGAVTFAWTLDLWRMGD